METIYKYPLSTNDSETTLSLPTGATVLRIDSQGVSINLWAIVDTDVKKKKKRTFEVFGTGHPMRPLKRRYVNTFFVEDNTFVFHAFEQI